MHQDYQGFYDREIRFRKLHLYPPYCKMSAVGFLCEKESDALSASKRFFEILTDLSSGHQDIPLKILGPAPMRIAYVNKIYRYRLVLKSRGDRAFRNMLRLAVDTWYSEFRSRRDIRMFVDLTGDTDC